MNTGCRLSEGPLSCVGETLQGIGQDFVLSHPMHPLQAAIIII